MRHLLQQSCAAAGLAAALSLVASLGAPTQLAAFSTTGDSLALNPVNNPFGAVVYNAHPGTVEDVMVAGTWRKRHGKLVGVDLRRVLEGAKDARDHVFASFPEGRVGGDWMPS